MPNKEMGDLPKIPESPPFGKTFSRSAGNNPCVGRKNESQNLSVENMENVFPEQFVPTDECASSIWANGIFVFDANILLNLYRHSTKTRDQLFDVMDRIRNRVFLPHQVAFEFFRHREGTIAEQINAFEKGRSLLRQIPLDFQKNLTRHPSIPIEKISEALLQVVNQCIVFIIESQPESGTDFLRNTDPILSRLNDIFRDCTRPSMKETELEAANAFVQDRFEKKLAPCFTSAKTETNPHQGDGLVWYQILEYAREVKKPIIFVTADTIENWWRMAKLGTNERAIGPHFQLIHDIRTGAGEHFLMYTQDEFLQASDRYLQTNTNAEAVQESRQLRESDADLTREIEQMRSAKRDLDQMYESVRHTLSDADRAKIEELRHRTADVELAPLVTAQTQDAYRAALSDAMAQFKARVADVRAIQLATKEIPASTLAAFRDAMEQSKLHVADFAKSQITMNEIPASTLAAIRDAMEQSKLHVADFAKMQIALNDIPASTVAAFRDAMEQSKLHVAELAKFQIGTSEFTASQMPSLASEIGQSRMKNRTDSNSTE